MKICFVPRGTLKEVKERNGEERADLFLFGFGGMGEVDYEKELKGETAFFEDAALLSKTNKSVVVCGCITNTRGYKRKSAFVAENGRIVGVSDISHVVDREMSCGVALRVYETKIGKMGVAVAEDLNFPETLRCLTACGSDFIVCPFGKPIDELQSVLLRAHAYCYGSPILFCGDGYCMLADSSGKIVFASPQSPALTTFENIKEYHLIETRRRGFYLRGK